MNLAARDTFRSLSNRNFRLFFAGQFVSQVGNWMTMVALGLLILDLTDNSGVALGLLTACQFAPVLVFGAWSGLVADRSDKRKLLMIVQVGAMLQTLALAVLAFMHEPPIATFYIVGLLGGFATALDNPARRSYVVELVPEADVQNAVSLNSAMMTSSRIFGPLAAGLLISWFGYGWAFLADGISYVAVLYGLWLIDSSVLRPRQLAAKGRGQVRAGLRYVRGVPVLWVSLLVTAVIGTLTFNFTVTFPLFVKETLGGDTTSYTVLMAVTSFGSLIGALLTARRRTVELRDVLLTATLFGLAMLLFSAAPNLTIAYGLALFVGLASISFLTTATAIVQLRADPVMRGRVLALQAMVFLGSTPIGGPIMGAIADVFGARSSVVVGGVGALAAAGIGYALVRRAAEEPPVEGTVPLVTAAS